MATSKLRSQDGDIRKMAEQKTLDSPPHGDTNSTTIQGPILFVRNAETRWEVPAEWVKDEPATQKPEGKFVTLSSNNSSSYLSTTNQEENVSSQLAPGKWRKGLKHVSKAQTFWGATVGLVSVWLESQHWKERAQGWELLRTKVIIWASIHSMSILNMS